MVCAVININARLRLTLKVDLATSQLSNLHLTCHVVVALLLSNILHQIPQSTHTHTPTQIYNEQPFWNGAQHTTQVFLITIVNKVDSPYKFGSISLNSQSVPTWERSVSSNYTKETSINGIVKAPLPRVVNRFGDLHLLSVSI